MSEASVVRGIERELKRRGAWYANVHGSVTGRNGIPDILACYHGVFLAIEAKARHGRTTRLQVFELSRIGHCGGCPVVIRSARELRRVLDLIERYAFTEDWPALILRELGETLDGPGS